MSVSKQICRLVNLIAIAIATCFPCYAQGDERTLEKLSWQFEPIEVTSVKTKGRLIEFGRKFNDQEDWLTDLTIVATNISEHPIVRIEIQLIFPRNEGLPYVHYMHYGKDPSLPDAALVKRVLPGETAEVKINPVNLPIIQKRLLELGYPPKLQRAQIQVASVTFDDGTMWNGDFLLTPDPQKPTRKINPQKIERPYKRKSQVQRSNNGTSKDWAAVRFHHLRFRASDLINRMESKARPTPAIFDDLLPCNVSFLVSDDFGCAFEFDACRYRKDFFITPTYTFMANARKQPALADCEPPGEDIICENPSPKSSELRIMCGQRIAGSCGGQTLPGGGCDTGFTDLGGYCGRSYAFQNRCAEPTGYDQDTCTCPDGINTSPIVIDVDGNGFQITDALAGVPFNILNDGVPLNLSWTAGASTNAFLVLDRNGNGTIDSGEELFGNLTPQPSSQNPNGFLALAEYDKPSAGGNANGRIERGDAIYPALRLWQDTNHNGISESSELHPLASLNVYGLDLDFEEANRVDQYGNRFRYRAKVYDGKGSHTGRWAYDVFLMVG